MKKVILIFFSFISSLTLNAQGIKFRHLIESGGVSVMTTTLQVFPWGQRSLEYALQFEDSMNEGQYRGYSLHIYFKTDDETIYVPQGGKLLIRTTKDEVITLEDCGAKFFTEYSTEYDVEDSEYRSKGYYDNVYKHTRYVVHGKYMISEDDLKKFISDGVIKIRIETTGDPVQCEYKVEKTNKTAVVLQKLYDVLVSNIDPYYGL